MFNSIVDTYLLIVTPASEKRRLRLLKEAENHLMDCERELENAQGAVQTMRKRVARLRKPAPTEKVESVAKGDITQHLPAGGKSLLVGGATIQEFGKSLENASRALRGAR